MTPPGSSAATGRAVSPTGAAESVTWRVAEEVAVALEYNGRSHAVMMATPADLEDFAIGFSLSEGIIGAAGDVERLVVSETPLGRVVRLTVDPLRLLRGALRRRSMEGRSGCGLCGVDSLANAVRDPQPVSARLAVEPEAIAAAFRALPGRQPMNQVNHSVHAAAWCDPAGTIALVREDVGRHNALDKLIGALMRDGTDPAGGFVALTSRCSFELVQKAAAVGVPLLATLSAPTALALDLARQAGMTLAARAPGDGVVLFQEAPR
ncbi:formate dehydrogenase accessory sulfurtransferase FdhD [Azospirillum griseum]|uniref:Sulfur carrier protein FdhD n=1 Tax=Azospirillum griseum TaxID=2496639 RepID=A0A3S0HXD9_9PROT|nr:formate dehydrogenase accessory sulfurtransferase FdhD [Azospirillum griseum]RTR20137.1 formate dehydrogenase accessory sulfurtransferase FdhD [Azospirillum griseum]